MHAPERFFTEGTTTPSRLRYSEGCFRRLRGAITLILSNPNHLFVSRIHIHADTDSQVRHSNNIPGVLMNNKTQPSPQRHQFVSERPILDDNAGGTAGFITFVNCLRGNKLSGKWKMPRLKKIKHTRAE